MASDLFAIASETACRTSIARRIERCHVLFFLAAAAKSRAASAVSTAS
jgi:hypothetical protein